MFTKYFRDRFSSICLVSFPQMSNVLLLKSVPLAQPQISNKIMCPYYPYVVLYIRWIQFGKNFNLNQEFLIFILHLAGL